MKKKLFLSENFQFLEVKFSIYLNRRIFVMSTFFSDELDCAGREGMFPISDCRSFLWCYAGGKHVQFCAAGTAFNAMTSVCDIHLNAYEECP